MIRTNQKGFTLVELIVVVAILGVLAAVAIPNYMNYLYKSRISTDVDTARAVLNVARTMTMTGTPAGDLTTEKILSEADMDKDANAATGKKLSEMLGNIDVSDVDNYKFTLSLGDGAGTWELPAGDDGKVTERGDLPVPQKKTK